MNVSENTHPSQKGPQERIVELEKLVEILSSGKYMWESTFDAISSPLAIISSDYEVKRANVKVASVAGCHIREVIGKKCYEVYANRTSPCEGCPVTRALREDGQTQGRLSHPIHGRDFEVSAFPYANSRSGVHDHVVVYYRDITEEKRLQQEVIQQEKMAAIGILAGGVAHEINNPLGGILALTQLLLRDPKLKETTGLVEDLKEIESASLRCKKIVADLLEFSRSSGKEKQLVNVNDIIEKVFPFLKMELKSYNIQVHTELDPSVPPIAADGNRLQQVFLNFLTNACHAMSKGGTIYVKTSLDAPSTILIAITDTGCGISPENLEKVFDPFFTTKSPGKGTGLGLSISYRIIRDHGGTIDVQSAVDQGTTFLIRLPVNQDIDLKGGV